MFVLCALLAAASGCRCGDAVIQVTVSVSSDAGTTQCVRVFAQTPNSPEAPSDPIARGGASLAGQDLKVGVYQDELPQTISLLARGYDDQNCSRLNQESAPRNGQFDPGRMTEVTLELGPSPCIAGPIGTPCGDAGICGQDQLCVDAGSEVLCDNTLDDDNDGDTDCADTNCLNAPCTTTNMCVETPRCQSNGTCGGSFRTCTTTNACYANPGACVPPGGACTHTPAPGNTCDDGNPCTETDRCDLDGGCASSAPCSRPPACYTAAGATCTGAGCTYLRLDGGCNDNNACTFNDQCDEDAGCAGTAYTCPPPSTECRANPCNGDGGCGPEVPRTGQPCDGGICTAAGACSRFAYIPSNFDPDTVAENGIAASVTVNCATAWFNSTDGGANWCSGQPAPVVTVITQDAGVEAVVLAWAGMTVTNGGRLTLIGSRPVIIAVYGNATIDGTIAARSAIGSDAGAGSDPAGLCDAADGGVEVPGNNGGAGGGGGGYGFIGGDGGSVNQTTGAGGVGGRATGSAAIDPLRGGCSGGPGGRTWDATAMGSRGGAGGGAVQISASGTLTIDGTITTSGAGGLGGRSQPSMTGNGGGGGGSGGAVLLEGLDIDLQNNTEITANGGGGGGAGSPGSTSGTNGTDGVSVGTGRAAGGTSQNCNGATPAGGLGGAGQGPATAGGNGVLNCGAAGGGGAAGRIRVNGYRNCTVGSAVFSPAVSYGGDAGVCP